MNRYNIARFDFVSIRLAVLCSQSGTLTAAAAACHLVLPAASRRIRDLEISVGAPLFERHSRGLHTTEAGRTFVKHGLILLQEMDGLIEDLCDLRQGARRHVRLTSSTAAINQFLPPLLADYAQAHPEVYVDLNEQDSATVVTNLRDGRADVGVYVEGQADEGLDS